MRPTRFAPQRIRAIARATSHLKTLIAAAIVFAAFPTKAATFLVDFGSVITNPVDGITWNNFTGTASGASLLDLKDVNGVSFPYDLTYTGGVTLNSVADNSVDAVLGVTPAPFNQYSVIRDSYYRDVPVTFRLSQLDPELTYEFTFYAFVSRGDSRRTNFTIGGSTVSLEPANTASGGRGGTATISNVAPNAAGEIEFTVSSAITNNWIFNAVQITSIPEPSTALLGLAGAAVFLGGHRRRLV